MPLPTLLLLSGLTAAAPAPTVLIDNPYVRVVEALDRPHARGPLHEHKTNRVMVYLTKCDTRIAAAGGRVEQQHWKAGDVAWSPARGPHSSENPNDTPCRIVEIELKPGAGRKPVPAGPLDPVAVDAPHYRVEIENEQVRVLRARYGARESGPEHEHARDRVTVFLTPAELLATSPDGKVDTIRRKAGDVGWGTVSRHAEVNLRDAVFEVIAVELKARQVSPGPSVVEGRRPPTRGRPCRISPRYRGQRLRRARETSNTAPPASSSQVPGSGVDTASSRLPSSLPPKARATGNAVSQ